VGWVKDECSFCENGFSFIDCKKNCANYVTFMAEEGIDIPG